LDAIEIIKTLQEQGYEAYLVGGCVRDMLLGIPEKDKDVVTSATPDQIMELFKRDEKNKVKECGENFAVILVNKIEVASYRTDVYTGFNDKSVKVTLAKTLVEDVYRRDLSVNGIAFNPINNKLIDYCNGQEDLKNKLIRFIGDPKHRIFEDPNRIIRACRFKAKIDGIFDDLTLEHLKLMTPIAFPHIKKERIRLEILKAMEIEKASIFFEALHEIGMLKYIFPTLDLCYGHAHGPHHNEDIFTHMMLSGDSASTKYPLIKLAAYLHDIGKPLTCKINPKTNDFFFLDHAHVGAKILQTELLNLRFSKEEINLITGVTDLHMRIIPAEKITPKCVRRILSILNERNIQYKDLLRLSFYDGMGRIRYDVNKKVTFEYYKKRSKMFYYETHRPNPVHYLSNLALKGNDIIEILNIKPGVIVGEILNYLYEEVLDNPDLNNKEELTKLVIEYCGDKDNEL